ncbi:MAG: folylpolyglutamate synthase/dihydrofolate synthase family protein [archaeon]
MDYDNAMDYLNGMQSRGTMLGLDRIKELMRLLENPEKKLRIIHVAGTNGKGSVVAMICSVLKSAGFRVGQYTSPHLIWLNERIAVNGQAITDKALAIAVISAKKAFDKVKPTFFEALTALALKYFHEMNCEFVVLETGLGGRLDATNIVDSIISIITPISLEHTEYLGPDISQIAAEKAGIIKKNSSVVAGANGKAQDIIAQVCSQKNARLVMPDLSKTYVTGLAGHYQQENAAIAVAACMELRHMGFAVSDKAVSEGLLSAVWPGRFERVGNILYDCAHNTGAVKALVKSLRDLSYGRLISVVGILSDKDARSMISMISPISDELVFTAPDTPRAIAPETLRKIAGRGICRKNVASAIRSAVRAAHETDLILVTGSCYTVGEAKMRLHPENRISSDFAGTEW